MQYWFDVGIAQKFGVNLAIFLKNLCHSIVENQSNQSNFHDGRFWTYNKVDSFRSIFPFWTAKQIRTIIDDGIKKGLIIKGNHNNEKYDRTCWYSLTDEGHKAMNIAILPNFLAQTNTQSKI